MAEPFKGNKFKYTESELKDRGCEKFIEPRDRQWPLKKTTYSVEGVWGSFTTLKDSLKALLTSFDGHIYTLMAHNVAQAMMDTFLIRRSRGENVEPPRQVVPVNAAPGAKDGIALISEEEFTDKNVSENEKLRWIFENMQLMDIKPSDAPSAGAWALLQELRGNTQQRQDFYKTLWPKLLTKEDAEKGGRLQDDGAETIKLIERLEKALKDDDAHIRTS